MSNISLFPDDPAAAQVKPAETCNGCEHRQRVQCGGSIIQYCGVRSSNRTENGLLKIKCKDKACQLFTKSI